MKIGIFGGSFNPPHSEHKAICDNVKREIGLDKIVLLPTGNAPHKKDLTPFSDRVAMISLLFDSDDYVIDDTENTLTGLTNSARVLPMLKQKYDDVSFIIGGDSMIAMDSWIEPDKVMTVCPVIVVSRGKNDERLNDAIDKYSRKGAEIRVVNYVGKDCSSTTARTYLRLSLDYPFTPKSVYDYAKEHNLYGEYDKIVERVKSRLTPERFAHTEQVVIMAVKLNEQLSLPYEKVFLSALLHDVAKYHAKTETDYSGLHAKGAYAHAFVGAEVIQTDFGISDIEIINAVRFHTTGRADMSMLEKLIYLADYIEYTRRFDGVEELRTIALNNFETGFVTAVARQFEYLKGKTDVCPLTEECYRCYVKK